MYETFKVFTVSKLYTFFFNREKIQFIFTALYIIPNDARDDEKSMQIQW